MDLLLMAKVGDDWFWPNVSLPSTHIVKPECPPNRNAVVVEGGDLFDDPAAQQQYQCRNSGCMVHVQIEFKHSILSSSLKISHTRKASCLPIR